MPTVLLQDLRTGARLLARNPGFTFIAILSLAIGIGANTATFSFADGLLLRPLPVSSRRVRQCRRIAHEPCPRA
jgi:hypothetical protein